MLDFHGQFETYVQTINQALPTFSPQNPQREKTVVSAMEYSLLGGGKRIRGMLTLAFYRLFEADVSKALPFAAAIEMVHAYSLIHDDLPCMDDDDVRRGKPACHIAYGEAMALLAGDALLNLAYETMAKADDFSPQQLLNCVVSLASASGSGGMIGGQVIDLEHENKPVNEEILFDMYTKKTGALISSACEIGCILGGANAKQLASARSYAAQIGLMFQIVDDILDCESSETVLGKPVGSDQDNGKTTYAALIGVEACREKIAQLFQGAQNSLSDFSQNTSFLSDLAAFLMDRQN